MNFQYLTYMPLLPTEVENDAINQMRDENLLTFKRDSNIDQLFKMWFIKPGLTRDWLTDYFGDNYGEQLYFRIQAQTQGYQPPHRDPSRTWAINYYLNLGGDNSITNFYQDVGNAAYNTPVESHKINLRSWCRLEVTTPHNVTGITDQRIAITVCNG